MRIQAPSYEPEVDRRIVAGALRYDDGYTRLWFGRDWNDQWFECPPLEYTWEIGDQIVFYEWHRGPFRDLIAMQTKEKGPLLGLREPHLSDASYLSHVFIIEGVVDFDPSPDARKG